MKKSFGIAVASVFFIALLLCLTLQVLNNPDVEAQEAQKPSRLIVTWTSGDREVALKMVYMYTFNAKKQGWFDEVRFLVWGPSSKLLSEDKELQDYIKRMKDEGVELFACKACADMYGVSDKLASLGIDVKYMGKPLTDMLQSGWTSLTF